MNLYIMENNQWAFNNTIVLEEFSSGLVGGKFRFINDNSKEFFIFLYQISNKSTYIHFTISFFLILFYFSIFLFIYILLLIIIIHLCLWEWQNCLSIWFKLLCNFFIFIKLLRLYYLHLWGWLLVMINLVIAIVVIIII